MATIVIDPVPLGTTRSVKPPALKVQVTVTPTAGATSHAGTASAAGALMPREPAKRNDETARAPEIRVERRCREKVMGQP